MGNRNIFRIDPYTVVRILAGDPVTAKKMLPSIFIRGMFGHLYGEVLQEQKRERGAAWSPKMRLPVLSAPILPKEWWRSFHDITNTQFRAGNILAARPEHFDISGNTAIGFRLTAQGIQKEKRYLREDQRLRTERIWERMTEHAREIVAHPSFPVVEVS